MEDQRAACPVAAGRARGWEWGVHDQSGGDCHVHPHAVPANCRDAALCADKSGMLTERGTATCSQAAMHSLRPKCLDRLQGFLGMFYALPRSDHSSPLHPLGLMLTLFEGHSHCSSRLLSLTQQCGDTEWPWPELHSYSCYQQPVLSAQTSAPTDRESVPQVT